MRINTTSITINATHEKGMAQYRIEFTVKDKSLERAQMTVYHQNDDPEIESEYTHIGVVYLEGGMVSCNIPAACDLAFYFLGVQEYIAKIDAHIEQM